jgi:FtsZ-interacting cell division protein ZipA
MRLVFIAFAVCALLALLLTLNALWAQEKPPKEKPASGDKPTTESLPKEKGEEDLEEEELESLKRAWKKGEEEKKEENPSGAPSEEQDPLEAIAGKMKIAERRLSEEDPGDETQKKELEAIDLLNDLIKRAEEAAQRQQQQQQQQQKQQKQQQQQQQQQKQKLTDPNKSNPAQPDDQRQKALIEKTDKELQPKWKAGSGTEADKWGSLPARDREDANAGSGEEFPERYKELLERYYKELMRERNR